MSRTGWICPKCGKALAPFIPECDCYRQGEHRPVIYPNASPQRLEKNEERDEWKRLTE